MILFKPKMVTIEYNLLKLDGTPYIIPESAGDDLMKLAFVDNFGEGFGQNPAEIYIALDHPKDAAPAVLLEMQRQIIEVLENHEMQAQYKADNPEDQLPSGE